MCTLFFVLVRSGPRHRWFFKLVIVVCALAVFALDLTHTHHPIRLSFTTILCPLAFVCLLSSYSDDGWMVMVISLSLIFCSAVYCCPRRHPCLNVPLSLYLCACAQCIHS